MKLTRKCQRCSQPVDEGNNAEISSSPSSSNSLLYSEHMHVLDSPLGSLDAHTFTDDVADDRLARTLQAGWYDRAKRINRVHAYFDKLDAERTSMMDLDGKACSECVRVMFAEYDQRLSDTVDMVDRYYDALGELEHQPSPECAVADDEAEAEEHALDEELALLESELQELETERWSLEQRERYLQQQVDAEERRLHAECGAEKALVEQHHQVVALWDSRRARLQRLEACRVHENLFSIARAGSFPVINSFRLGSLPTIPVEWDEVNAALGEASLLLHVCGSKLNYHFRTFRPVALGDASRMQKVGNGQHLALHGSVRTTVFSSLFNDALGALLGATDEIAQAVFKKYRIAPPYQVTKDMIGESQKGRMYSIKRPMRDTDNWVKALMALLGELKWLLAIVVSADRRGKASK